MKTLFVSGFAILLAISAWATLNNDSDMTQSQNSGNEGIKVHGDWEVKIIDPDGSSEVFAFKNALTTDGAGLLTQLILGESSVVDMGISAGMKYKKLSDPTAPPIYDWGQCANNADSGLGLPTEINSSTSSDSPPSITLTASCIVWLDHYSNSVPGKGNLDTVWTKFAIKNLETNLIEKIEFTSKKMDWISVETNQILQFAVKISFE